MLTPVSRTSSVSKLYDTFGREWVVVKLYDIDLNERGRDRTDSRHHRWALDEDDGARRNARI
jgi:hypothetical protein